MEDGLGFKIEDGCFRADEVGFDTRPSGLISAIFVILLVWKSHFFLKK